MSNQSAPDALTKAGEDAADELRNTHGYNGDVEETVAVVLNCVRAALAQTAPQAQSGEAPYAWAYRHGDSEWTYTVHEPRRVSGTEVRTVTARELAGVYASEIERYASLRAAAPAERTEPKAAPTRETLIAGLRFYAEGDHFNVADGTAWDTVSGEPPNFWCDDAGTATVEDGSVAKAVLEGKLTAADLVPGERTLEELQTDYERAQAALSRRVCGDQTKGIGLAAAPTDGADRC